MTGEGRPGRRPRWFPVLGYVAGHLFLDWVSFIHELAPLNITPWNPPSGLACAVLLLAGGRMVPVVWLALVASDALVRGLPVAVWATLASNLVIAAGYGLAAWLLRRRLGFDPTLGRLRDIVLLLAATAATAAAVAVSYVSVYMATGLFPWAELPAIAFRYWVGEVIGITVVTPLVLVFRQLRWRPVPWTVVAEGLLQAGATGLALWVVLGPLASARFNYFYLLFLPAAWAAVRHGLPGATWAAVVTQVGLIVALASAETPILAYFQLLMLALAAMALMLGAVVSERQRAEAWIRERQAEISHAARLTEAGEMASALAHELNQPLAATISYIRAGKKLAAAEGASARLAEVLDKGVAQAERADQVIRSLRAFLRKGEGRRQAVRPADLVADAITLAAPVARQHRVAIATDVAAAVPNVLCEPVQVQQVLLNLIRNGVEAIADTGAERREIRIGAAPDGDGAVRFRVRDSGPGVASDMAGRLFHPFATTKAEGMGLGLSIARSIVEAHGGILSGGVGPGGGSEFSFTIPAEGA